MPGGQPALAGDVYGAFSWPSPRRPDMLPSQAANGRAEDEPGEMMALLNDSMFDDLFDGGPMSLDDDDLDMLVPSAFESGGDGAAAANGQVAPAPLQLQQQQLQQQQQQQQQPAQRRFSSVETSSMAGGVAGGFSAPSNFPGGSTVTEFTKRRNWSAKVMEELKDLLQILDSDGRIKFVSPNVQSLTGYSTDEIRDMLLRDLIHPDDVGVFVAEMNESIASGQPLRMFYRFKKRNGSYAIFESVGHAHVAAARFAPNPHNQSPFCQAVFVMSRPYPTRNAALLDSFLEHKMENERLRQRIAELRQEEEAEAEDAGKQWLLHGLDGGSDVTPSENTLGLGSPVGAASAFGGRGGRGGDNGNGNGSGSGNGNDNGTGNGDANASGASGYVDPSMPPPERRPSLNAALTRENLEGAAVGSRPDSLRDKMARYEGAKHAETIEMLTGLRYLDGERSRGITTGNASPALIKGDVGIAISLERDVRTGEKIKKKLKTAEEYVCTDCGTLDSPEWRKGPSGPKTLCNACGLRWAKKEKKRHSGHRDSTVEPGMG